MLERLALLLALSLASCVSILPQDPADLPFRTGTIDREDGRMRRAFLAQDAELERIPCRDWVHFDDAGRLHSAELARDFAFGRVLVPAGSRFFLREDLTLKAVWLSEDREYDGIVCNGGPGKICTSFHPSGRVWQAFLPDDQVIQGVPCEASVFAPVELDADGRLVACRLSCDWSRDGASFESGDDLRFDATGRPRLARD